MSEGVINEIHTAQQRLAHLSRVDRRQLLCRIMDEVVAARSYGLSNGDFQSPLVLEQLIASTCDRAEEIADMDDAGFLCILDEFAKLLTTMQCLFSPGSFGPRVLH